MAKYSSQSGGGKIIIIKKKKKKKPKKSKKKTEKSLSVSQKQNVNISITQPVKRVYKRNRSIKPKSSAVNYQPPILIETQRSTQSAYNNLHNTYAIRLQAIEKGLNGITGNMNNLTSQIQNGANQPLIRPQPGSVLNKPAPIPDINKPLGGLPDPLSPPFTSQSSVKTQRGLFENLKADAYFKEKDTLSRQASETETNLDRIEDLQRSISQASEEAKEDLEELQSQPVKRNIRYVFKRRQQYSSNVFNRVKSGEITEQEALELPESKEYQRSRKEELSRIIEEGSGGGGGGEDDEGGGI